MRREGERGAAVVALALVLGCAPAFTDGGPPQPALAEEAERSGVPNTPERIEFAWSLRDRDARFQGDGVARLGAGYRARLDLFGPRGETYLAVALVDWNLRLPPGVQGTPLPPPALLWSVLGIFRAPPGAELVGTRIEGNATTFDFAAGGQRWRFRVEEGILRHAEWVDGARRRQTVEVRSAHASGRPLEVIYRDWAEYRELEIRTEVIEEAAPFPPETWTLEGG